jgi:hypothetical protein
MHAPISNPKEKQPMANTTSMQLEIDELNKRLKELEGRVPPPKPAPIPKKQPFSQVIMERFIDTWRDGSRVYNTRPVYSQEEALRVAAQRAKETKLPKIVFIDWMTPISLESVGPDDCIIVVEEVRAAVSGGTLNLIRTWEFSNPVPEHLTIGGL